MRRVIKVHLKNFKRFTDLVIDQIPDSAKLVLLIGSNGSGKSSVFDAFGFVDGGIKKDVPLNTDYLDYFKKDKGNASLVELSFSNGSLIAVTQDNFYNLVYPLDTFYGRTSFRQIPRLTRTTLGQINFDIQKDSDRSQLFIEKDNRFENDIERFTEIILKEFFRGGQSNEQIRSRFIDPVNDALKNIFGEGNGTKLQLIEFIPPLEGKIAQVNFKKGNSEIHYNYLSAGEKEVFNILINLLSRNSLYTNTIYFFDEIDLHLNTKIQFNLLKEIVEHWIPANCQLWTASHSLGFIEYAKQTDLAAIIDFDDLDFDLPSVLSPEPKDNPDVYEIAVGKEFLPSLFRHMTIYFVENKDKEYYASVGIPNTVFVSENNRNGVYHKVRTTAYLGVVDRDFLSDEDIKVIREKYSNLYILHYYSIENYMYHPDNLEEYYNSKAQAFDKSGYIEQLTNAKNQAKSTLITKIALTRTEYPYFSEPEYTDKPSQNKLPNRFKNRQENFDQSDAVAAYLESNELETYYKSFPMKSYATHLPQRQNISKTDLTKTSWFAGKITKVLATTP